MLLCLAVGLRAAPAAEPAARPNIIFLLTDDQRDNTLGAMGHPFVKTPKLQGNPFYDSLYRNLHIHIPDETGTDPYRFIPEFILDQDQGRRTQTYTYAYGRETCLEHHVRYYQTITGLDHVIGQLRADLNRRDLARNTVILYGSDHGLLMGEYGIVVDSLIADLLFLFPTEFVAQRILESPRKIICFVHYARCYLLSTSTPLHVANRIVDDELISNCPDRLKSDSQVPHDAFSNGWARDFWR
jgi:hypothetical protein